MKTLNSKIIALAIVLTGVFTVNAQDFHISQYDNSLQQINPAYTGYGIDKDYRVNMNHRSQWSQITTRPYRSFLFSYDQKIDKQFNVGGYFISNNAGDNDINSFNAMLSGSYNIIQSPISEHKLTAGLQLGVFNRNVGTGEYIYDSQYSSSTGTFDTNIESGEVFNRSTFTRFDAAIGMFYDYVDEDIMFNPYGGFSLLHIGMPNESLSSDRYVLPLHWVLHAGTDIRVNQEWNIVPNILYMHQRKAYDFNFGVMGEYKINATDYTIMAGVNHRWADAVIAHAGFKFKSNVLRVSYDFNTSYLNAFTGGRGGLEVSLVFIGGFDETMNLFKASF